MNYQEFCDRLYYLRVNAGASQRYHQRLAALFIRTDRIMKILTGMVAIVGCVLAFMPTATCVSQVFAIGTAVFAVSLNVLLFSDWGTAHADLFRRWTALLGAAEQLDLAIPAEISEVELEKLAKLQATFYEISASEPQAFGPLWSWAERVELRSDRCGLGPPAVKPEGEPPA